MEVLQGVEYSIIKMPKNISADVVDSEIAEFTQKTLAENDHTEFLLDMTEITQLHRACLVFITLLGNAVKQVGRTLSIAGLQDAVENALRFNHVDTMATLFKNIIDFERQKEIVFDFGESTPRETPLPEPSAPLRKNNNVLVVDSSIASRNNQKSVFGKLPIANIIEAKDLPEAVKRMRSISFPLDLIIVDFQSVKALIEEFVRNVRNTPLCQLAAIVVMVADNTDPKLIEAACAKGISGAVIKNYGTNEISKFLK
jgi:CheY-like chemotaxis protein/anti-anti-sigma regulatory factor